MKVHPKRARRKGAGEREVWNGGVLPDLAARACGRVKVLHGGVAPDDEGQRGLVARIKVSPDVHVGLQLGRRVDPDRKVDDEEVAAQHA
jgi:hypothetical protein